jgi:hypothetical protein
VYTAIVVGLLVVAYLALFGAPRAADEKESPQLGTRSWQLHFDRELTAPEVAALALHANPKVTLGLYAGLADDGREKAISKLAEGGFGQ